MAEFPEFESGRNIWPQEAKAHPLSDKSRGKEKSLRAREREEAFSVSV
jgi:hypothetical protein